MRPIRTGFTIGIAALLFLALAGTGFLGTRGLDLTAYREQISTRIASITGRTFEIAGDLKLRLRKGLVIAAHDVKLGNADWGSGPTLLQLRTAELRLALYPLLQGEVLIEHVALDGPILVLETDESGRGNWELDSGDTESPIGLNVASISISSGSIEWRGDSSSTSKPLRASDISLEAKDDTSTLAVTADARVHGQSFRLQGHVASPRTWKQQHPITLDALLSTEAGDFQIEGTLEQTSRGIIPRLSVAAQKLDTGTLAQMAGHHGLELPALSVTLDLAQEQSTWIVDVESAALGNSDLAGSIRLEPTPDRLRISGAVTADRIDLGELFPPSVETRSADTSDQRLFSSTPIDMTFLSGLDMDVALRAARLGTPRQDFRDTQLHVRLHNDRLALSMDGSATEGKGKLRGELSVDADGKVPIWSLNVALTQYPASALQRAAAVTAIDAPTDVTLDVSARGISPQQMVSNLTGSMRIVVGKGRAQMKTVDNLVGGLSTIAGQMFEEGTNDTQLNCVVGDLKANNGVVSTQVALIDSAASTLRVDGKVDLGTETIDVTVTPKPKKPTLTVAVPVHVRGSLQDPAFEPDRTSSLAKLIGVGSLLVYPPAAIVALGDLGDNGNACTEMIENPRVRKTKEPSPVRRVAESIGDAASAIGLGIKRLFGE